MRRLVPLVLLALLGTLALPLRPAAAAAALSGAGSTYVGQAMNQWVGDAQTLGLPVQYTANGSTTGLNFYNQSALDFAGTEAEFASVYGGQSVRSYQYVPDAAGATALMYNVKDAAGRKVDYLHLSPRTIAAIFTGVITSWNDPQIRAENLGTQFADQKIHVILRSGQSGTTALFYDFVKEVAPDLWAAFRAKNQIPDGRVLEIQETAIPGSTGVGSSDAIAQYLKNDASGSGAISYDEFGYARFYQVPVAWVQNATGHWVQPYSVNISAALDGALLRPDLSQELTSVYSSRNPLAYPVSAYSYIVAPCAPAGDRRTCKDPALDPGRLATMAAFLDYISCQGQVKMALLGYSPLPPVLSQEVQRAITRLGNGAPPARTLSAANCSNPRFTGGLGVGSASPPDPFAALDPRAYGGGGTGTGTGGAGGAGGTGTGGSGGKATGPRPSTTPTAAGAAPAPGATAGATPGAVAGGPASPGPGLAAGQAGATVAAVGGGTGELRASSPVAYRGAEPAAPGPLPAVLMVLLVAGPPLLMGRSVRRRRHRRGAS